MTLVFTPAQLRPPNSRACSIFTQRSSTTSRPAAAALAAAYMLRLFSIVFFGPFNPRWSDLKDLRPLEAMGGVALLAGIGIMGVWWAPFTERVAHTVTILPGVAS